MAEFFTGILNSIFAVIAATWWVAIPVALFWIFWRLWVYHIYVAYLKTLNWIVLEVKVPANIEKTPKSMEQVFAAVYGIYSFGFRLFQIYLEGHLREDWISFELVGFAGGVHFYIRTPAMYKSILESAIYAQYPDAEVHQVPDYMDIYPRTLPNKTYDIWGTDYHLIRNDAYPIKTYEEFEENIDERRLDPIAAITEVMSKLKNDEMIAIQIFVSPTGPDTGYDWKAESEAVRDKLAGRKKATPPSFAAAVWEFFANFFKAPHTYPEWAGQEEKKDESGRLLNMTGGERDVMEAIEKKISKLGFETNIRFIFVDRRDSFTRSHIGAVMATFHQFTAQNLNGFRPNVDTFTIIRGNVKLFKNTRMWYRKRRMWETFKRLYWPKRTSILNTEELATLYHFPSIVVEAPLLRRLGAKKGEPPAGLPTE